MEEQQKTGMIEVEEAKYKALIAQNQSMQKELKMQKAMVTSESIGQIASALAKFNVQLESISKDKTNPFFKSAYLSLDMILNTVRPLLAEQGLSILQFPSGNSKQVGMVTILLHESGEFIQSTVITTATAKNDIQNLGSCISYLKRYSVSAMLGISADEDDDGNVASGKTPPKKQTATEKKEGAMTSKQKMDKIKALVKQVASKESKDEKEVMTEIKKEVGTVSADKADNIISLLEGKLA